MRRAALLVSAVLIAATAWPALRSPDDDSYPLSTYPMFARARPPQAWFATAVALDGDGAERRLAAQLIGGTAEPVHAAVTVQRAIDDGRSPLLCTEVANRVAGSVAGMAAVEVVSLLVDLDGWYEGAGTPLRRVVHARCDVPPAGAGR